MNFAFHISVAFEGLLSFDKRFKKLKSSKKKTIDSVHKKQTNKKRKKK